MAIAESKQVSFQDLPPDLQRYETVQTSLAVGMYVDPKFKVYDLNLWVDKELSMLGHEDHMEKRLIINMPPQLGKTTSVVNWMVHHKLKNPERNLMYITYSAARAQNVGSLLHDTWNQVGNKLHGYNFNPSSKGKVEWNVQDVADRSNIARGINESITGYSGDVIVFDDPYSNPEEAWSPAYRRKVQDTYETVVDSRTQEDSILIFIQTRWHKDDITGYVMQQEASGVGDKWRKLILPAIANEDIFDSDGNVLYRKDESPDARRSHKYYLRQRKKLGPESVNWNALYQQVPVSPEGKFWDDGSIFECVVEEWPDDIKYLTIGIDPVTGKDLVSGDYAALVALGINGDGNWYCEADMSRSTARGTLERLVAFADRLPKEGTRSKINAFGFEDHNFQNFFNEEGLLFLAKNGYGYPHQSIFSMPVEMFNPATGKMDRNPNKHQRITQGLDNLFRQRRWRFIASEGTRILMSQIQDFPPKASGFDDGPDAMEISKRTMNEYAASVGGLWK